MVMVMVMTTVIIVVMIIIMMVTMMVVVLVISLPSHGCHQYQRESHFSELPERLADF